MNELEKALRYANNDEFDFYLELTSTESIRRDIEEIRREAADQSDATRKIDAIKSMLLQQP